MAKQKIGVICPSPRAFSAYVNDQLPEHPEIEYIMINKTTKLEGQRFNKVIFGYDYAQVKLSIRLQAQNRIYK